MATVRMTGNHLLDPHLDVLKSPSHFAADGARIIVSQGGALQIAAVLHEINQTILGRRLEFSSPDGRKLVLSVLGRRILRLDDVKNALHAVGLSTDHTQDIAQIIRDFVAPLTEVRVTSSPLASNDAGLDIGLHVAELATLLDVNLSNPVPQKPSGFLTKIVTSLGQKISAWILHDVGGADQRHGPDAAVTRLRGLMNDSLDDLVAQLASIEPDIDLPALLVVGPSGPVGYATVFARADNQFLLGILNGASATDLQHAWAQAES